MTRSSHRHRDIGHSRRHGLAIATAGALALGSGAAGAALVEFTGPTLQFETGTQSIWGGGVNAGFSASGVALGSARGTNVSYAVSASSGTVQASARGNLEARYQNSVELANARSVSVALDFLGEAPAPFGLFGGSRFSSDVGASVSITGTLDLGALGSPTLDIFSADYDLSISDRFTAETPRTVSDGDSFTASNVGVGLPTAGIGLSGEAGVDLDIAQDATVTLSRITGTAVARHAGSGETRSVGFSLASSGPQSLDFDLGLAGRWDIGFEALRLFGSYSSLFSMDILPFIGGGVGVFCGDPFTDDDNVLCTDTGVKANRFIGFDLFRSPSVALGFNTLSNLDAFSIDVTAAPSVAGVPEPATLALLGGGFAAMVGGTRRRRRS